MEEEVGENISPRWKGDRQDSGNSVRRGKRHLGEARKTEGGRGEGREGERGVGEVQTGQ